MTKLDTIREALAQCLTAAGIHAVTAWGAQVKTCPEGAVVTVCLRGCEGRPGGFQDYLGERYDPDRDRWEELYGRKVRLTFGLDIYASGQDGGARCQAAFDQVAAALQDTAPLGLHLECLSREETVYDRELGLFRCPVQAVCDAYLYAVTDEEGVFVDFEIRGGKTNE